MEHCALGQALANVFPDHSFEVRPKEKNLDGFTSCDVARLDAASSGPVPTNLEELAKELVNAILPGRRGHRADFAYVLEDLELCNRGQPELVLSVFRNAVDVYIRQTFSQRFDSIHAQVRERCSFHLFRPMTEAYFFGDAAALERAGASRPHQLPSDLDLEEFRTVDQEFLDLAAGTRDIVDMPDREFHPKHYLRFLCDPTLSDRRKRYKEKHQGAAALMLLNWSVVLGHPLGCSFLHAFLDDLGEALNSPLPFVNSDFADSRARFPGPRDRILRNL